MKELKINLMLSYLMLMMTLELVWETSSWYERVALIIGVPCLVAMIYALFAGVL